MPEILVIREKDVFSRILIENGFSVTNFPTLKTETVSDLSELESYLSRIETFDGIFITSRKAAEIVSAKLSETANGFNGKFYVLGKRSSDILRKFGYETFYGANVPDAEALLKSIPREELKDKRFLFPRGNRSLRVVPETLKNIAEVFETIVYRTIEIERDETELFEIKEKFDRQEIKAISFFSPSGVEGFLKKFENFSQNLIKIAAIGQTTARFAAENSLRVDFISAKPTAKFFAAELTKYLRKEI